MTTEHVITNTGVTVTTTAETIVASITIPPMVQSVGDGVMLSGDIVGTSGTGTTGIQVRVRQDTITGSDISVQQGITIPVAASTVFNLSFAGLSTNLNQPTGRTFVVTIQQVGATGNATGVNTIVNSTPCTPLVG